MSADSNVLLRLIDQVCGLLSRLAEQPRLLFAACFALNAVLLAYVGIFHDAELYAGQTLQAADGRFSDDLFFKYGGQSRFTLLPAVLAPLAVRFGVEPVFFVAYLFANALRLWATQLLVFRLLGRTPAAAAGILLNAAAKIPLGVAAVFLVNEPFFTARVPAIAFAILGLERTLARRWAAAAALFALSAACHPLIAVPAVAIAVAWTAWEWATTSTRRWVVVGALVATAAVGVAYLWNAWGSLDPEWRRWAAVATFILDPLNWPTLEYVRLAVAGGCALALGGWLADRPAGRFLWVAAAGAGAGVAVALLAAHGSWALLYQGQAYRAVWPLELLRYPVGFAVVARLWTSSPLGRTAAVALFAFLLAPQDLARPNAALVLAAGLTAALLLARVRAAAGDEEWPARGLILGLGIWAAAYYGAVVPARMARIAGYPEFANIGFAEIAQILGNHFGPLARFSAAAAGATVFLRLVPRPGLTAAVAIGIGLTASAIAYVVPRHGPFADRLTRRAEDIRFVRGVLAEHWREPRTPTVYWPATEVGAVWVDLNANCYFTRTQIGGGTFSRELAADGFRRAGLVLGFEIDQLRRDYGPNVAELIGEDLTGLAGLPPPTPEQFRELARQPDIDFLVLPTDFGGAVATNGRVWVYRVGRSAAPRD